jgi:hypothetical protein
MASLQCFLPGFRLSDSLNNAVLTSGGFLSRYLILRPEPSAGSFQVGGLSRQACVPARGYWVTVHVAVWTGPMGWCVLLSAQNTLTVCVPADRGARVYW